MSNLFIAINILRIMHTSARVPWLTLPRLKLGLALLVGGFLLLAVAGFAWATVDDDVNIEVTSSAALFVPGDTMTFTVTTENTGPAYNVDLEFRVNHTQNPKPIITVSTMAGGSIGTASNGSPTLTSLGQALPTGTTSYEVTVEIPSGYTGGNLNVRAEATNAADADDNEAGSAIITLNVPKLTLVKTGTTSAQRNGAVSYVVTANNTGAAAASNVIITDSLPLGLTGVSSGAAGCSVNPAGTVLTCGPFSINPSASKAIAVSATVSAIAACGQIQTNQASVSYNSPQGTPLPTVAASANTTVVCPTPTPTTSSTPTPTPTPTPAASTSSSTSNSSGTAGTGSSSSGSSTSTNRTGRIAGALSGPSAADLKAPDYIPHVRVPLIVEQLFGQVYGRRITPPESTCWKLRARSDKATLSKLKGAMAWHKAHGSVGYTKFCQPPKLSSALVDDLFKLVYNRAPSASELKYWQKRHKDKPRLAELRGAMLFHKAQGIKH